MKKVLVAILIVVICLLLSSCCSFCPPGDHTQVQVSHPCWPCWKKEFDEKREKELRKMIENNRRLENKLKENI